MWTDKWLLIAIVAEMAATKTYIGPIDIKMKQAKKCWNVESTTDHTSANVRLRRRLLFLVSIQIYRQPIPAHFGFADQLNVFYERINKVALPLGICLRSPLN